MEGLCQARRTGALKRRWARLAAELVFERTGDNAALVTRYLSDRESRKSSSQSSPARCSKRSRRRAGRRQVADGAFHLLEGGQWPSP